MLGNFPAYVSFHSHIVKVALGEGLLCECGEAFFLCSVKHCQEDVCGRMGKSSINYCSGD